MSALSSRPRGRTSALSIIRSLPLAAIVACSCAHAADDQSLTWNGITLYGVVDLAVTHEQHGAPLSQDWGNGLLWMISKASNKPITTLGPGYQSRVGIRGKEGINDDIDFIFNGEVGFDPWSGNLSDGPASLIHNNGVPQAQQRSGSDSPRAGQLFNGVAYAGLSSKTLGTLTLGRNPTFILDTVGKYDPMNASFAFSLVGFSGTTVGGGNTENSRLDDSVKYVWKYDWFHAGALYQFGKTDSSPGEAWQGNLGADYGPFSIDGVYWHKKDSISLGSLTAAQLAGTSTTPGLPHDSLAATISDNTSYTLGASWTAGPWKIYGGYEHIKYENPDLALTAPFDGLGGYEISVVNNTAFPHPKVLQVSWGGVKYLITPDLDITAAGYHYDQNAYGATKCSNTSAANCSGTENVLSLRLDYRLSKRLDIYAGAAYSKVHDGLANGFLYTSNIDPTIGARFQF